MIGNTLKSISVILTYHMSLHDNDLLSEIQLFFNKMSILIKMEK